MKKLLVLAAVYLVIGIATLSRSQNSRGNDSIRSRFFGGSRLAWLEEQGADGKIHRADCTGLLAYTRDGHISVQVMYRNPATNSKAAINAAPVQYAQGGYEASFATYKIDESTHTFTFHVEGALVRSLVGRDLPRAFEFTGNQLIVKSTSPEEHWRVAWEHN